MQQPIKYITVIMKEATASMESMVTRKLINNLYTPVVLDDLGLGKTPEAGDVTANKAVIGVLMESFPRANMQHKVLVEGIVGMRASAAVKAGQNVYWSIADKGLTEVATDNIRVGIAMSRSLKAGDSVNVLVK